MQAILITMGRNGFMIVRWCETGEEDRALDLKASKHRSSLERIVGIHFAGTVEDEIVSVSGAGDCLTAGFIAGMLRRKRVCECAAIAMTCASKSLKSHDAVPHDLAFDSNQMGLALTELTSNIIKV